ncbi:MAG: haloacid dehalogenase-like hydrolase [Clostridia bacterium]|nr:haloacid dehalogenase-like hydrolase [Clostridia bacterium]
MRIDVYDFDGTIYDGDSTFDFVLFCLRRHPRVALSLPAIALAGVKLALKKIGLTQFKSALFGQMVRYFSLTDEAKLFWQDEKTKAKLGAWFYERPRDLPIVIASASPEFELRYAADILGVKNLIGTRCNDTTGELIGKNCKGAEKISRIRAYMGEYTVRAMYTDNTKADGPLLEIAEERYKLTHGKLERI